MASHLVVRVCAIAVTIGICSIATLAEPISMSAKPNTVSLIGRSQPDSAFLLHNQAISVTGANSLRNVGLKSQTTATSFSASANTQYLNSTFDKNGPASCVAVATPEPSAILLLGSGLLSALGYRSKRKLAKSR